MEQMQKDCWEQSPPSDPVYEFTIQDLTLILPFHS